MLVVSPSVQQLVTTSARTQPTLQRRSKLEASLPTLLRLMSRLISRFSFSKRGRVRTTKILKLRKNIPVKLDYNGKFGGLLIKR